MDILEEYVIHNSECKFSRCEYVENDIEIDCYKCQKEMIKNHDKQVRKKVLDEVIKDISTLIPFFNNEHLQAYFNICEKIEQLKEK